MSKTTLAGIVTGSVAGGALVVTAVSLAAVAATKASAAAAAAAAAGMAELVGWQIEFFLAANVAGLVFLLLTAASEVLTCTVIASKKRKLSLEGESFSRISENLRTNVQNCIIQPASVFLGYLTQFITFVIGNYVTFIAIGSILAVSYIHIDYYQDFILAIDDVYETIYDPLVVSLRYLLNVLRLLGDIGVGALNFVTSVIWRIAVDSMNIIMGCPGYWSNIEYNIVAFAKSIAYVAQGFGAWIGGDGSVPWDFTASVQQLRLIYYDLALRFNCACEADQGLISVTTQGVLDDKTNYLDVAVSEGINAGLSTVTIFITTVYYAASTGQYTPPAVYQPIGHAVNAINALEPLLNNLLGNAVAFIEASISQAVTGSPVEPWQMVPLFSIPGRIIVSALYLAEVGLNSVFQIPSVLIQTGSRRRLLWSADTHVAGTAGLRADGWSSDDATDVNGTSSVAGGSLYGGHDVSLRSKHTGVHGYGSRAGPTPKLANSTLHADSLSYTLFADDFYPILLNASNFLFPSLLNVSNAVFVENLGGSTQYLMPFAQALNQLGLTGVGLLQYLYETATRVVLGPGSPNVLPLNGFNTYAKSLTAGYARPDCQLGGFDSHAVPSSNVFTNFWVSLYDSLGRFEQLVTVNVVLFGDKLGNAVAPYYPPFRPTISFAVAYVADAITAIFYQFTYVTTSLVTLSPISIGCIEMVGVKARTDMDNFILSLPDYLEHILDVSMSSGLQNAHFNCKEYNFVNYVYIGSLKSYYFLSEMCNTRYHNGRLVTCSFYNVRDCPHEYNLAYHDFNAQALCALDIELVGVAQGLVRALRLVIDNVFTELVNLVDCIISLETTGNCNYKVFFDFSAITSDLSFVICTLNELVLKLVNIFGAFFGLIMIPVYQAAPEINQVAYDNSQLIDSVTFLRSHTYAGGDPSQTFLQFQHYPIEAGLVTLIMCFLNVVVLWLPYFVFLQFQTFLQPFNQIAAGTTVLSLDMIYGGIMADAYQIVEDIIRIPILAMRDVVIGFVEFIRVLVYVGTGGQLSGSFTSFQAAINTFVTLLENVGQMLTNEFVKLLMILSNMFLDVVQTFVQPGAATTALMDFLNQLMTIFEVALQAWVSLLFQLPGFKDICVFLNIIIKIFNTVLGPILEAVQAFIKVLNAIIQPIVSLIHRLKKLFGRRRSRQLLSYIFDDKTFVRATLAVNHTITGARRLQSWTSKMPFPLPLLECSPSANNCPAARMEATLCNVLSDCMPTSYCIVESPFQCATDPNPFCQSQQEAWDMPCQCSNTFPDGNNVPQPQYFCNFASGYCQAGVNPFINPMASCPASNALVQDNVNFDALCWIAPVWKCNPGTSQPPSYGGYSTAAACFANVYANAMTGPFLCRDFCDPSPFNVDNQLVSTPSGCACAVGLSVGAGLPLPDLVPTDTSTADPTSRRRLLAADARRALLGSVSSAADGASLVRLAMPALSLDDAWGPSANGTTACVDDSDCDVYTATCFDENPLEEYEEAPAPTLLQLATGASGRAVNRPCSTCRARNPLTENEGFRCRRARCTCERVDPPEVFETARNAAWEGSSHCAIVGRSYSNVAPGKLSALEYVALRDCVAKYKVGQSVRRALGLDAVSPAVAYDATAAIKTAVSLGSGFAVGLAMPTADWDALHRELFKLRINPELGYAAAQHGQRLQPTLNVSAHYLYGMFNTTVATAFRAATMFIDHGPSYDEVVHAATFAVEKVEKVVSDITVYHNETVHDIVHRAKSLVFVTADGAAHRAKTTRRLLSFGTPLQCEIMNRVIADLKLSANTAKRHFTWNIPRAACHLQSGCDLEAHPASWMGVAPPAPPAPAPPPPLDLTKQPFRKGWIKTLLDFLDKHVSKDVSFKVSVYWSAFSSVLPGRGTGTQAAQMVLNTFNCDYEVALMCEDKNPDYSLVKAFVFVVGLMFGIKWALEKFFTGPMLSFVMSMVLAGFLFPHVWLLAYNVPLSCSLRPGTVPVCAVDDAVDFALGLLPRHIPWPSPIINTAVRISHKGLFTPSTLLPPNAVLDCRADPYGFTTGERYLIYAMERFIPHWRRYVSQLSLHTFVGEKGVAAANYYHNKPVRSEVFKTCSQVALPAVIPLLFYGGCVFIALMALLNVVFVFTVYFLRSVRNTQDLVTEVYVTVGNQAREEDDDS